MFRQMIGLGLMAALAFSVVGIFPPPASLLR